MNPVDIVKYGTPFFNQLIQPIIEIWLKPKLKNWRDNKIVEGKLEDSLFDNFSQYLITAYKEFKNINLISLGNEQIKIDDIYQSLTLVTSENEEYRIDSYNDEIVDNYRHILIEDVAGMGKSTLLKKMFISAIEENKGLPIFIELKKMEEKSIMDIIFESLSMINKKIDQDFILELINRGDFIFFLDGYDEIPFDIQQRATEQLKSFIQKASNNVFFLTSRHEKGLTSFGQFKKTRIKELSLHESFELIKKLDNVTNVNIANELIDKIKKTIEPSDTFNDLNNFLSIPLLITLVYITFRYKRDLSTKKDEFYEKVYNALYEDHDLSKDYFVRKKRSNLSKTEFFKVLSNLGYLCLKDNKVEYKESVLLELISQSLNNVYGLDRDIKPDDVLHDLLRNIPLLYKFDVYCKWAHKSFMEYFAACYVQNNINKEAIIRNIFNSERFISYLNFLDIFHDIDTKTFDKIIVLPILNNYLDYMDHLKGSHSADFKSKLYNKIFYISVENSSRKSINQIIEIEKKAIEDVSSVMGFLDKSNLNSISIRHSEPTYIIAEFAEDKKYNSLIHLLNNKNKPFFKFVEDRPTKPELQFSENKLVISRYNIDNINVRDISNFEKLYNVDYFDFEATKQYKAEIETTNEMGENFSIEGF